jgi:hypothetical protein
MMSILLKLIYSAIPIKICRRFLLVWWLLFVQGTLCQNLYVFPPSHKEGSSVLCFGFFPNLRGNFHNIQWLWCPSSEGRGCSQIPSIRNPLGVINFGFQMNKSTEEEWWHHILNVKRTWRKLLLAFQATTAAEPLLNDCQSPSGISCAEVCCCTEVSHVGCLPPRAF